MDTATVGKPQRRERARVRAASSRLQRPVPATRPTAVVHLSAEYWPFAQTGGLGMAVSGLARCQAEGGLRTTVLSPLYRCVRESETPLQPLGPAFEVPLGRQRETGRLWQFTGAGAGPRVVFVEHDGFFQRPGIYGEGGADYPDNARRFAFFTLAALRALPRLVPAPAVLHAHDWHTALAPVYLRAALAAEAYYDALPAVLSVHNAAFQGQFSPETLEEIGFAASATRRFAWQGCANWLKAGLALADLVTTVSPTHARELQTAMGGFGLHEAFHGLGDRLLGVPNGIDPKVWDPRTDPYIAACYSADDLSGKARCKTALQRAYGLTVQATTPLVGMCARLVGQKGFDLILDGALRSMPEAQFVFVGQGEERYARALTEVATAAPERIAVHVGFTDAREHRLLAGADLLLMPSLYEPCGITQMHAQRYGTIPVARRVGGLADTIEDEVTGFLFDVYSAAALERALRRALSRYRDPAAWVGHIRAAMNRPFGWDVPAAQYAEGYSRALRLRRSRADAPQHERSLT
jgi:starch synthase